MKKKNTISEFGLDSDVQIFPTILSHELDLPQVIPHLPHYNQNCLFLLI